MKQKNKQIYMLTSYALITALICIFAPLSVPIGPIPISLTNLVLYFSIYIIGFKGSTVSYTVYLLLGLVGLPVFSGGAGGPAKVVGPTGGYLLGFFFITIFCYFSWFIILQEPIMWFFIAYFIYWLKIFINNIVSVF